MAEEEQEEEEAMAEEEQRVSESRLLSALSRCGEKREPGFRQ